MKFALLHVNIGRLLPSVVVVVVVVLFRVLLLLLLFLVVNIVCLVGVKLFV